MCCATLPRPAPLQVIYSHAQAKALHHAPLFIVLLLPLLGECAACWRHAAAGWYVHALPACRAAWPRHATAVRPSLPGVAASGGAHEPYWVWNIALP